MKAGKLDREITIERQGEPYDDGYTTVPGEWEALATVPAQVMEQGGHEYLTAEAVEATERLVFRVRWMEVKTTDRVRYGEQLCNIMNVKELGRFDGLEIMTVAAE